MAIFGDGALEQGVMHESLNFAALNNLQVLFVCEDNGLAVHSSIVERQAFDTKSIIEAYGIGYSEVNQGFDFSLVAKGAQAARTAVCEAQRPHFLKVKTARYREHVGPGEDFSAGYRKEEDIESWKAKDPLIQNQVLIEKFDPIIIERIDQAVALALKSPYPDKRELLTDVI